MRTELTRFSAQQDLAALFGAPASWHYGAFDANSRASRQRAAKEAGERLKRTNYAFDAASGGGMAFLASQLELPEVELVEPLASVTHDRDIPIKTGGGYVEELSAWASNYSSSANNNFGIQENKNQDIGIVQTDVIKGVWNAYIWAQSMRINYVDLQKMITAKRSGMPMPYSLQELLDTGLRLIWNKALDKITYQGIGSSLGLMNNTAITSVEAPQTGTGSSPLWSNKTTTEILNDINTGIITVQQASGYAQEGIPDTLLLDYEHWGVLNQPMTTGGFNSLLEYILANNVARRQGVEFNILPLPDPWISTAGTGGTSEGLFYRKDPKALYLKIPQPVQKVFTVPSVQATGYETLFMGCIGQVQILRPTTMLYMYGW
jgi:hypothetical protein